ncbi:unnamed protein product [Closterium sp. NIES-54]
MSKARRCSGLWDTGVLIGVQFIFSLVLLRPSLPFSPFPCLLSLVSLPLSPFPCLPPPSLSLPSSVIEVPGGLERYPPPLPLEDLARPELLCSLVQLLLRAKSPTFRRILEVLSILCRGNKQAASELHRFGCFPMLLWKVVAGDISHDDRTRILKFLARTHLLQDPSALERTAVKGLVVVEHLPWNVCILNSACPILHAPRSFPLTGPIRVRARTCKGTGGGGAPAVAREHSPDVPPCWARLEAHSRDTEDIDTEDIDTEDMDTEDMDTEDIDTEDIDTEDIDTEDIDTEDIDTEDIDTEDIDTEDIDTEDIDTEDIDMPQIVCVCPYLHHQLTVLCLPRILISPQGAELFLSNLDTEDIDTPEIVWNEDMKERLRTFLEADLQPYVQARAGDPHAVYVYEPKPPLVYPELAGEMKRSDGIRGFNKQARDPHAVYVYEPKPPLVNPELAGEMNCSDDEMKRSDGIRGFNKQAQDPHAAVILDRYPQIPLGAEAESVVIDMATPALRVCIAQRDDCPPQMADILQHAAKILRGIAATRDKDADVSQPSINFALSVLSCGARVKSDGSFPDSPAKSPLEPALSCALSILELAASSKAKALQQVAAELLRTLVITLKQALQSFTALSHPFQHPPIPSQAGQEPNFRAKALQQVAAEVLRTLAITLEQARPPDSEPSPRGSLLHMQQLEQQGQEPSFRAKALQQVAAEVLRTLAITLEQALPPDGEPSPRGSLLHMQQLEQQQQEQEQGGLLSYVIPWGLLDALKNPDAGAAKLVALVGADGEMPTAIWNAAVREELRGKVEARIKRFNLAQAGGAGGAGGGAEEEDEVAWLRSFR